MKYLSLDPGLTHTGVAISHEGSLTEGLTTISTSDSQTRLTRILHLINTHQPDLIVIGQPDKGPVAKLAQKLATEIESNTTTPTKLVNEDLSSKIAQKALIESNQKQSSRQSKIHQASAAAILQDYLENLVEST